MTWGSRPVRREPKRSFVFPPYGMGHDGVRRIGTGTSPLLSLKVKVVLFLIGLALLMFAVNWFIPLEPVHTPAPPSPITMKQGSPTRVGLLAPFLV